MRIKLFKRFYFTTAVIIVVCLAFMVMTLSFFVSNHLTDDKYKGLERNCTVIGDLVSNMSNDELGSDSLINVATAVGNSSESVIFITDSQGAGIVCSCDIWSQSGSCEHTLTKIPTDILDDAMNDDLRKLSDLKGGLSQINFVTAKNIIRNDGGRCLVFAVTPASKRVIFFSQLFKMYIFSAIIPLVLIFVAEYILIYKMTRPLRMMSDAAKAMSRGDFSKRIPVVSDDEIGELAISFNQMTNSLARLEGARRNFVANVSHEFRTPITTIGGFIDGIIDGTIEPQKQDYYLKIVSKEVKRLTRLVQSMLSLSRLESGETVINANVFDLRETILSIVISQEQRIEGKNINIVGLNTIKQSKITADMDLIHQAIYNLVDNAIKFTNNGGYIAFDLKQNGSNVVFKIKNSGQGISNDDRQHIFERFYKKDRSRSENSNSIGLGLYIVKTIIDVHSGSIVVSGECGKYTEFIITLPVNNNDGGTENER